MTENQCKMKEFLKAYLELFEGVLVDEKEKLKNFTTFDINKINASIAKQQANELKIANIEAKRIELQKVLGYENMTFKEIIATFDDKKEVNELYRKISTVVHDIKFYNQKAMELAKGQLVLFETVSKDSSTYSKTKQKFENQEQIIKEKF